ncbi:MAG: hypothetical protein EKK42_05455 [Pseudonocardiaceae bacterium]|nr:MAG: hypothetical protein EKK42_05455 [Pseudonocardiaceae bacterium]
MLLRVGGPLRLLGCTSCALGLGAVGLCLFRTVVLLGDVGGAFMHLGGLVVPFGCLDVRDHGELVRLLSVALRLGRVFGRGAAALLEVFGDLLVARAQLLGALFDLVTALLESRRAVAGKATSPALPSLLQIRAVVAMAPLSAHEHGRRLS